MALFQKKPQTTSPPIYSLGLNKTIMIVGLGNPGREYEGTRHNIGFACVDALARKLEFDPWTEKKDLKCLLTSQTLGTTRVFLVKPTTFMNRSGEAVQSVSHFYKVPLQQTVVVYDDKDIPFGQIRTRMGGKSAGHNGIKSIIQSAGKDFGRVRIGIGSAHKPSGIDTSDFVLAPFAKEEEAEMPALTREVNAVLTEYIYGDELPHETRSFLI